MSALSPRTARISGLFVTAAAVVAGLVPAGSARAVSGAEAPAGGHPSVVRLSIGDEPNSRACTGSLVEDSWVLTASSCFAATAGSVVPAGAPALKSTATLSDGKRIEVAELVPRADRDVVLARLAAPAAGIAGVRQAGSTPSAGADLRAVGFGRTRTTWVPDAPHTGAFTLNGSDATTLTITGKGTDALCKGDTGGPLLNAANELVGVNSRSWQGGCLGTAPTEARTGAVSSRTDDLAGWIGETTRRPTVQRDLNGDGRSDAVMVYHHANSSIGFYGSLGKADGGFGDFTAGYTVPAGSWDRSAMKLVTGDFNGDRRSDIGMMYRHADGSIKMYTGLADAAGRTQEFTSSYGVPAAAGWVWNAIELYSGDVNGD
ncbi:trypsin-like serine protease, partial [Streptomyces bambusae]|uniref:trypsin-like serine protease n=1 Tax=Streptomyces bambusae TaxID=1550616 RepID=UPI001CFEC4D2